MIKRYKVLFLGETYRADAITWMNGIKEFGPFEIDTWELGQAGKGFKKLKRLLEVLLRLRELKQKIIRLKPDLIIAERVTSYGFIAALFHKYAPVAIAQQGITDIYPPHSITAPIKKRIQQYAFKHASLIHAWGDVMTKSMLERGANPSKIMVLAKGIDLRKYSYSPRIMDEKIRAVITRSLTEDYRHETVLKAFAIVKQQKIPFQLIIIGDGRLKGQLMQSVADKNIQEEVVFAGRIPNTDLPAYLSASDLYISMPCTEGVSASLFEAMAAGCYPVVSDLPGNRAWVKNGDSGSLVEVDDVEKLASIIQWYFKDRSKLQNALAKNRWMVEQHISYQKNMQAICNRYLLIIENNKLQGF